MLKHLKKIWPKIEKLREVKYNGPPGTFTNKKRVQLHELEDKYFDCEMELEIQLANREKAARGSKIDVGLQLSEPGGTDGPPRDSLDTEEQEEPTDKGTQKKFTKPKRGDYPAVGPLGPGDLNVEGDWEGPIELFEFGESDDGWVNCTTGYYWHPALGGGIYIHEVENYRNWEYDYEPPESERVLDEPEIPEAVPKINHHNLHLNHHSLHHNTCRENLRNRHILNQLQRIL